MTTFVVKEKGFKRPMTPQELKDWEAQVAAERVKNQAAYERALKEQKEIEAFCNEIRADMEAQLEREDLRYLAGYDEPNSNEPRGADSIPDQGEFFLEAPTC